MIVLDASAALELLLRTPAGDAVQMRIADPDETLHAPHLIDLEVAQVVRRYQAARALTPARGREVLEDLADLDIVRYPHTPLLARIWNLRNAVSAYEGAYLALAEVLDAPFLTCNRRLASASLHTARVELVEGA